MPPILANAGVPMLALHLPVIFASLLPIILVEALVARRLLGRPLKRSLGPVAVANAVSMLAGFPLLWFCAVAGQMLVGGGGGLGLETWWQKLYAVTVQSAWLIPYESDLHWMIPAAGLFMLIPAFFVSVWIERIVLQRFFWRDETRDRLRRYSFRAHLASYLLLALVWLAYGVHLISAHQN